MHRSIRCGTAAACRAHDWDGDAQWAAFLSRFEISRGDQGAAVLKLKAK
jgi:hypothetical protein